MIYALGLKCSFNSLTMLNNLKEYDPYVINKTGNN